MVEALNLGEDGRVVDRNLPVDCCAIPGVIHSDGRARMRDQQVLKRRQRAAEYGRE